MDKRKIGLFDSGLGGLSVLRELLKILPNEDYLFYEDSLNSPYGDKSDEELLEITSSVVDYLLSNDCKIIVIACNTATTSCMKKLREKYPDVVFVGTVPAIKVAYDKHFKNTILLSTPYTSKSIRVSELIGDYKHDDQKIINVSGENLANLIDNGKDYEISELLENILGKYRGVADSLVLGCTHYSLIKEKIQEVLPGVELLDGTVGVAKEVNHQLIGNKILKNSNIAGSVTIINSKYDEYVERSYGFL